MDAESVVIEFKPSGRNGTGTGVVKLGDEVLAMDSFNIAKASARRRFAAQVTKDRPGIPAADVERELLRIAGDVTKHEPDTEQDADTPELDLRRIVRPELFHTRDVSGVAVPTTTLVGGKPGGVWRLHLRWHLDGRREQRELDRRIELPSDGNLWLHPLPSAPTPTMRGGWSAQRRRAWLDGAAAPNPVEVFKRICERLAWFLDFPTKSAVGNTATVALWAMLTYC